MNLNKPPKIDLEVLPIVGIVPAGKAERLHEPQHGRRIAWNGWLALSIHEMCFYHFHCLRPKIGVNIEENAAWPTFNPNGIFVKARTKAPTDLPRIQPVCDLRNIGVDIPEATGLVDEHKIIHVPTEATGNAVDGFKRFGQLALPQCCGK